MDRLRQQYGQTRVHVKLAPGGEFEGVEPLTRWTPPAGFRMPEAVRRQLSRDDRVVVRPADRDVPFSDFLDLLEQGGSGTGTLPGVDRAANATAYLEYTSLSGSFPALAAELAPMPLATPLKLEHLNLWLSDGRTLGKLHFDPFENLLAMVAGSKELVLFAPHNNTRLYEGHLAEARLALRRPTKGHGSSSSSSSRAGGGNGTQGAVFLRDTLLESTSMVMSPVDLSKPEPEAFPLFADATPVHCRINPGDGTYIGACVVWGEGEGA